MKKIIIGSIIAVTGYFWLGAVEDPEFFVWGPFMKTHPCPKFSFQSPVGMGDYGDRPLSKEEYFEQYMFEQYFKVGGLQEKKFSLALCDMNADGKLNIPING